MDGRTLLIRRWLIATLGGPYNELIGRRAHLGAAAVIFDRNGHVLLVHHSFGQRAGNYLVAAGNRRSHFNRPCYGRSAKSSAWKR